MKLIPECYEYYLMDMYLCLKLKTRLPAKYCYLI